MTIDDFFGVGIDLNWACINVVCPMCYYGTHGLRRGVRMDAVKPELTLDRNLLRKTLKVSADFHCVCGCVFTVSFTKEETFRGGAVR